MDQLGDLLTTHNICPELLYNMDETMLQVGSGKAKVITNKDAPHPQIPVPSTSEHISLVLYVTASGAVVCPLIILPLHTLPHLDPNTEQFFYISRQNNRWITKELFLGWVIAAFIPHVENVRHSLQDPDAWALLLVDGHNSRDFAPSIIKVWSSLHTLLLSCNHLIWHPTMSSNEFLATISSVEMAKQERRHAFTFSTQ